MIIWYQYQEQNDSQHQIEILITFHNIYNTQNTQNFIAFNQQSNKVAEFEIIIVLICLKPSEQKDETLEHETSKNFESRFENVEVVMRQTIQQALIQQQRLLFQALRMLKLNSVILQQWKIQLNQKMSLNQTSYLQFSIIIQQRMLDTSRQDNILNRLQSVIGPLKKSNIVQQQNQLQNVVYSKYLVDSRDLADYHQNYQKQNEQNFSKKKTKLPFIYRTSNERQKLKQISYKNYENIQNELTLRDRVFQDLNKHKRNVKELLQINTTANMQGNIEIEGEYKNNKIKYDINMELSPKYVQQNIHRNIKKRNLCQQVKQIKQKDSVKYQNQEQNQQINYILRKNDISNHNLTNNHKKAISQITQRNIRNREMFINNQTNKLMQQQLKYHPNQNEDQLLKKRKIRYPLQQKFIDIQNKKINIIEPIEVRESIKAREPIEVKEPLELRKKPAYFYCQQNYQQKLMKQKHENNNEQRKRKQKFNYFISHNLQIKPKIVQIIQPELKSNELPTINQQEATTYKKWKLNKVQLEFVLNKKAKKDKPKQLQEIIETKKQINDFKLFKQRNQTQTMEINKIWSDKIQSIEQKSLSSELLTNRLKSISQLNSQINDRIRNIVSTFQQYLSPQNQQFNS